MEILSDVSLKLYNTFGVDAQAKYLVHLEKERDLWDLFKEGICKEESVFVLGGGSNVLFVDDFNGLVLHMDIKGIQHEEKDDSVMVRAGAGEIWNDLVHYCVVRDFRGIENLNSIPGTVGAAPVQNIGAYGVELKDVFHSCEAFNLYTGEQRTFYKEDCAFAYRESVFKGQYKGQYVITSVSLLLSKVSNFNIRYGAIAHELQQRQIINPKIRDISEVIRSIRNSKLPDPAIVGNSGSFFKNPIVSVEKLEDLMSNFVDIVYYPYESGKVKLAAGWLIEQCGWKGKQIGEAGTWPFQALVLVNYGNASGRAIYDLSKKIIDSVRERFDVTLEREVNVIGQV